MIVAKPFVPVLRRWANRDGKPASRKPLNASAAGATTLNCLLPTSRTISPVSETNTFVATAATAGNWVGTSAAPLRANRFRYACTDWAPSGGV